MDLVVQEDQVVLVELAVHKGLVDREDRVAQEIQEVLVDQMDQEAQVDLVDQGVKYHLADLVSQVVH